MTDEYDSQHGISCNAGVCASSNDYLAFVMLFFAATSLAVSGSGSDVGMGEFWENTNCVTQQINPAVSAKLMASFW